jgi:23S rRNA pseudouridine2605 synthase
VKKRLSKTLQAAGIASRRAAEELIFAGRCSVNGEIVLVPQTLVDATQDVITVDNKRIQKPERKVYFLLNKPEGMICSNVRYAKKTQLVIDLFQHLNLRLFTVGRLDKDTSGLLLVTNDGYFANRIIHPSFDISKEYLAKTDQEISEHHLKILSKGIFIENTFVKPIKVVKVRKGTVKITVKEGKKHEVRLMLKAADLQVRELTRIRVGPFTLGSLQEGDYRPLHQKELEDFLVIA